MNCSRYAAASNSRPSVLARCSACWLNVAKTWSRNCAESPVLKRLDLAGADVSPVGDQAHELVIAEQRHDSPTRALRVALEATEKVDGLARVRAAVEDVARLHEHRASSAPPIAVVDDLRRAQDRDEVVERPVDVAHGDNALGGLDVTD